MRLSEMMRGKRGDGTESANNSGRPILNSLPQISPLRQAVQNLLDKMSSPAGGPTRHSPESRFPFQSQILITSAQALLARLDETTLEAAVVETTRIMDELKSLIPMRS